MQPTGNLTFSGFQMSISPPLDLHYKSDSHPWGPQTLHSNFKELIGTHNTLFQHSASPQSKGRYVFSWGEGRGVGRAGASEGRVISEIEHQKGRAIPLCDI